MTTLPAYKAAVAATLMEVTLLTKEHLIIIIAAAKLYLQNYEEHKENIVGAVMQEKFKSFQEQATEDLEAPKNGWLYIQQLIEEQYQALLIEQKALERGRP